MSKPLNQISLWAEKFTFKKLVLLLLISLTVFLFCYKFFFKDFLLQTVKQNSDYLDRAYYSAIFLNLNYAVIITLSILIILFFCYRKIFSFLLNFSDKKLLVTGLILNFILQLSILIFIDTNPISDSAFYVEASKQLYSSGSYLSQSGNTTSFWPVGLPAYLAFLKLISDNNLLLSKLLNIIFSSFFIFLLFDLFKDDFSKKGKIIFLFMFILFPNNLFSSNAIMTDYMFSFLLWITIYLSVRFNNSAIYVCLMGVILGLMCYLRPIGLLLPVIFFLYYYKMFGFKFAILKSVLIIAVMLLVLSPWIYRNYIVFHKFIPVSTNGGFNFLMGNHKLSNGGLNFDFEYDINNPDEPQEERKAYVKALEDILNNPLQAVERIPLKIFHSYLRGDSSITWTLKSTGNYIPPVFLSFIFFNANFSFYLLILLTIFGLVKEGAVKNIKLRRLFLYLYAVTIIIIMIYVGGERYIISLLPVHFFLVTKFAE